MNTSSVPTGTLEHGLRLLLVTAEPHPTFRADVRVLFGKFLPMHGIASDVFAMVGQGNELAPWSAGRTLLTPMACSGPFKLLAFLRHSVRLIGATRAGYDAIVVRDRVLTGAIAALACRLAGVPFFYWASFAKPESRIEFAQSRRVEMSVMRRLTMLTRGWLSGKLLYAFVLPRATHVFVQSESMREAFAGHGLHRQHMTSVPMGIDPDEVKPEPALACDEAVGGVHRFVYLGDLAAVRSPQIMVQALALARRTVPDICLDLVGDALEPVDRRALDEVIRVLGLSSCVRVTGWLPVQAARDLVRSGIAGISFVPRSPTLDLSSPTKIVEYFALGLPVLANDSPDQASMLARIGAEPVECSAEALAAAMIDVVRRPVHYRLLAARGLQFVSENRSYKGISTRVAAVFLRSILGSEKIGCDERALAGTEGIDEG